MSPGWWKEPLIKRCQEPFLDANNSSESTIRRLLSWPMIRSRASPKDRQSGENWSRNLVHQPVNGEAYYYLPRNMAELKTVLEVAAANGKVVRVSGQRHSQTPLVVDDNRGVSVASAKNWLVDLACYADLGAGSGRTHCAGTGT